MILDWAQWKTDWHFFEFVLVLKIWTSINWVAAAAGLNRPKTFITWENIVKRNRFYSTCPNRTTKNQKKKNGKKLEFVRFISFLCGLLFYCVLLSTGQYVKLINAIIASQSATTTISRKNISNIQMWKFLQNFFNRWKFSICGKNMKLVSSHWHYCVFLSSDI